MKTDPRLFEYYETLFAERDRLSDREGQLEFVRTKELLCRFLPKPLVKIIDIGGGTGIHASWLAALGHEVHLVDIVPSHVEEASKVGTFTSAIGDARALPNPDNAYDIALLFGPLYHLSNRNDRLLVLSEACRVVRTGGLVVVAFISRGAVALDGYVKGWIDGPNGIQTMVQSVKDGTVKADRSGFSVVAYYHLPKEARAELESSGLEVLAMFGVEGPAWVAADFDDRWQRNDGREIILESAKACEEEPEMQLLSGHLLAFTRNP